MNRFYHINARLSADNGAKGALSTMFALARILDTKVLTGHNYNEDFIRCPASEEDCRIAEALMDEAKLVYDIVDRIPYHHPYSYENSETTTPPN